MIVHPVARGSSARPSAIALSAHRERRRCDLRGVHVLAVDDEPDALALVAEVLRGRRCPRQHRAVGGGRA